MTTHRFILAGGCVLAFGASMANVALVLQSGTSVSHLTGDISRLATDISRHQAGVYADALKVGSAAVGFGSGATLIGFLIHHPKIEISRPYGRTILFIGALFVLSHLVIPVRDWLAIGIAAFACGMQNSLATRYRGLVLRTTHLTGLFTDLGVALGMKLKGHEIPNWKLTVPASVSLSFFLGAVVGCYGALELGLPILPWTGAAYMLGGLLWSIYKRTLYARQNKQNENADTGGSPPTG